MLALSHLQYNVVCHVYVQGLCCDLQILHGILMLTPHVLLLQSTNSVCLCVVLICVYLSTLV